MEEVTLYFRWSSYKPDQREYRNQSIELNPSWGTASFITVKVPLKHEYISNSEEIIQAKLASNAPVDPVLTIAGMKYVIDQFDAVFFPVPATKPDEVGDDDWETDLGGSEPEKKSAPATDEDWETDLTTDKPDEVAWDETEEDWK